MAVHAPLPAPEMQSGEELVERQGLGDGHDLPGGVVEPLRQSHDQALCGPQSAARGGVAIGDILKKGFGVDGPATLLVEHR